MKYNFISESITTKEIEIKYVKNQFYIFS